MKSIISDYRDYLPYWEQLATGQNGPWQVVPKQVFVSYIFILTSSAFGCSFLSWLFLDNCYESVWPYKLIHLFLQADSDYYNPVIL